MNLESPALVLGLNETGLGVVRALGQAGIATFGMDDRRRLGFLSRHVKAATCPHPLLEEEAFVAALAAFAARHARRPALFLTADSFLLTVARHYERLSALFSCLMPSPDLLARLVDKHSLALVCADHGVPVPRSVFIGGPAGLHEAVERLSFPIFLKPSSARLRRHVQTHRQKGWVAQNKDQARLIVETATAEGGDLIAQEIVTGPDRDCFKYCACFSTESRPLAELTLRKLRNNPIRFGVASACQSEDLPEVMALGRRLLTALGYQGVGSIEFKRDGRDGVLKLIEINTRYWQQNSLATACGLNFPLLHYLEATGQHPEPAAGFATGIKWVDLRADTDSFLRYRREGLLSFGDWRRSLAGPKVYADYQSRDVGPALKPGRLLKAAAKALELVVSLPFSVRPK